MMDELLDPTVAAGEMNSSHLENAKRAISLLVDMGQTTKQDIDKAWNLLDRLVEELNYPSKVALLPKEHTSLLNGILTVWRQSVATRFYIRVDKRYAKEESKHVLSKLDGDGPFFQPNTVSYNEVMHALNRFAKYIAGTKRTRAAIRLRVSQLADTIVKRMNKKAEKNPFVKPDMRTFISLIFTYMSVTSPDAYERAEAILNHMKREGLKPGTRTYDAVFGVLVKTMRNAGEKAENFSTARRKSTIQVMRTSSLTPRALLCDRCMGKTGGSDKCTKGRRNLKHIQKQHDEGVSKHPKAKARIEMLTKEMEKEGFASIAL